MTLEQDLIREACRWDTAAWMEGFGKIRRKDAELVSPVCNEYQAKISEVVKFCHDTGRPCRIIALKPRQKGSSTVSMAVAHVRLKAKPARGLVAGGAHFQGQNLFTILDTYAQNDELDPGSCNVMDSEARYSCGSTMDRVTLANKNAGRSGTYQVLIVTEVAYLEEEGVADASTVMNGLLKCVPFEPDTIIIEESTAKGASGFFFDKYQGGITFEEFKAGKNGRIKIFAAWYDFADSRRDPASEGIHSVDDLTAIEVELSDRYKLDLYQVAWMRWAIREECDDDFAKFEQDYPFDDESCFLKTGNCRFNASGLRHQTDISMVSHRTFGRVDHDERTDRASFRPTEENEASCVIFEKPREGCCYLVSVDSMTGESQTGGDEPDSHSVIVHRAGFIDPNTREWVEPAMAARNMMMLDGKRRVCWWDIDVLEEEVYRLSKYYGNCIIVPEMNKDRGMVELLKRRGDAHLYRREIFNQREGRTTEAYGWDTTKKTRPMIIETLAAAIRESGTGQAGVGYQIRCPWAINQCKNFITRANGRAEASQGNHDDDVLSIAIGLQCINLATPFFERMRPEWMPPDLRGIEMPRHRVTRAQWA